MSISQQSMDDAEAVAKLVFETVLPGAKMEYRRQQSHGEYDFDLRYPNGTIAAIEVTESVDRNQKWMSAKISKKEGGSIIEARHCKKSWIIFVMDAKTISDIRSKLDEHLAKVEQAGCESFRYLDACTARLQRKAGLDKVLAPLVPRCVEDICCDLKIQFGGIISGGESPKIYIQSPVRCGARNQDTPIKAGEREAQKKDNKKKLGAAKAAERHLVVYIGAMNGLPWLSLTDFAPPSVLPNLPEEITHIWLIGHSGEPNKTKLVVWRASVTEP